MKLDNKKLLYIAYGLIAVFLIILILQCSKTNIKTTNIKTSDKEDLQAEFDMDNNSNIMEGFRGPHNTNNDYDDDNNQNQQYVQENCNNEPNQISTFNCLNNNNLNIIHDFINSDNSIKDKIQKTANLDWAALENLSLSHIANSIKKYNKLIKDETSKKNIDKAKEEILSISQLIYGIVLSKEINKQIEYGVQQFLSDPKGFMDSNNNIYSNHVSASHSRNNSGKSSKSWMSWFEFL